MKDSEGLDVPLTRLRPLRDRKITKREFDRILSSIKAVGLLEPLIVCPEGDDYHLGKHNPHTISWIVMITSGDR